jgi:hypothetical protein
MPKTFLAAMLAALLACASGSNGRTVRRNVVTSAAQPAIRIRVAPEFRYVGRVPFRIRDVAAGDRYVFVDADGHRVKRMFVLQFEGFLPGIDQIYRYDVSSARTIGGHKWRHNLWWYSDRAQRAQDRGPEARAMHDWLASGGWIVDDELLMSRFLTIGDETRKHELILFYFENARDHGLSVAELDADESRIGAVAKGLEERSLAAFRVLE